MNEEEKVIEEAREALKLATEGFTLMGDGRDKLEKAEAALSVAALKFELLSEDDKENATFVQLMDEMDSCRKLVTMTLNQWPSIEKKTKD